MEKLENGAGELFEMLDDDGNGFLTKDELDKAIVDVIPPCLPTQPPPLLPAAAKAYRGPYRGPCT